MRMRRDVSVLTADSLMGREAGTIYEKKAAMYIQSAFESRGLSLLYPHPGQDFSMVIQSGDTINSQNIVAIVEGWDPVLKDEFIVVGAHYDHLGYTNVKINGRDSLHIFRGADDNASGVAVMLEIASMVQAQSFNFRRSVIFAAFGAEERGMVGSWYFVNRAFAPIDNVKLMINIDMVGRAYVGEDVFLYTVMPDAKLVALLKDVVDLPLMINPGIENTDYFPSDHQVFAGVGIPVVLATTKLHGDYHTVKDTPDKLNFNVMEGVSHYLFNLVKTAANAESLPSRTVLSLEDEGDIKEERLYSQNDVDVRASYMRGNERDFLEKWVYHYLRYPDYAVERGIQGRVMVDFIVEKDGEISNVEVSKSVHPQLDEEAVRVIKVSPKWKAATLGGTPVRVKISVPVEFRLSR